MSLVAAILQQWADQFARQPQQGRGAIFVECRQRGVAPERAREMAQEAVQEALVRLLQRYGQTPEHYTSYEHFCNSVTRAAINFARGQLRQRRAVSLPEGASAQE
jgi:DNA-directed RNA polymerase specialized sigma24 family protein